MIKMKKIKEKHKFAVFFNFLDELKIRDKDFCRRIVSVLRLQKNDELIVFNKEIVIDSVIKSITKNEIELKLISKYRIESINPKMHIFIGLLKKESFEDILYHCVELGATSITPILSEKIHKNWFNFKYKERFESILISAAEQSKNFYIPKVNELVDFNLIINELSSSNSIFFDVDGEYILDIFNSIKNAIELNLIIGPEGDFSEREKKIMEDKNFKFCRLAPTVLRSVQALNVGLGSFRALFNL
jgi:16S rRNA (uracil1498-N3)-methyltransferase